MGQMEGNGVFFPSISTTSEIGQPQEEDFFFICYFVKSRDLYVLGSNHIESKRKQR